MEDLAGDPADDGKRSPALDVAFRAGGYSKGRGLGRGVGKIFSLSPRPGGFSVWWYSSAKMLSFALPDSPKLPPSRLF